MPVQGSFVEHDHMILALAANRANDTFYVGSLPGRARSLEDFLDSHGFHALPELIAKTPSRSRNRYRGICSKD